MLFFTRFDTLRLLYGPLLVVFHLFLLDSFFVLQCFAGVLVSPTMATAVEPAATAEDVVDQGAGVVPSASTTSTTDTDQKSSQDALLQSTSGSSTSLNARRTYVATHHHRRTRPLTRAPVHGSARSACRR